MFETLRRLFRGEPTRPLPTTYPRAGAPVKRKYLGQLATRRGWRWKNENTRRDVEHYAFRDAKEVDVVLPLAGCWPLHSRSMASGWEGPKFVVSFTSRWQKEATA